MAKGKSPSGRKVTQVMKEWGEGKLRSGAGPKVPQTRAGQKQAVAIALAEHIRANVAGTFHVSGNETAGKLHMVRRYQTARQQQILLR